MDAVYKFQAMSLKELGMGAAVKDFDLEGGYDLADLDESDLVILAGITTTMGIKDNMFIEPINSVEDFMRFRGAYYQTWGELRETGKAAKIKVSSAH